MKTDDTVHKLNSKIRHRPSIKIKTDDIIPGIKSKRDYTVHKQINSKTDDTIRK